MCLMQLKCISLEVATIQPCDIPEIGEPGNKRAWDRPQGRNQSEADGVTKEKRQQRGSQKEPVLLGSADDTSTIHGDFLVLTFDITLWK